MKEILKPTNANIDIPLRNKNIEHAFRVTLDEQTFYLYAGRDARKSFSGILFPDNAPDYIRSRYEGEGTEARQGHYGADQYDARIKIFDKMTKGHKEALEHMLRVASEIKSQPQE